MDKGKITAAFITLLLITTIIASLLPQATATPTTITTITPNSGPVGTTVRVSGEIDTLNGSYQIRWDGESVTNGTCEPNTRAVNDTFVVPPSTEGDHNVTLYDVANTTESLPQTFTVYKFSCQIQTVNLANETLPNVLVEVFNATTDKLVDNKLTNATGWTLFTLDPSNYTFKAFWKDVEVGVLPPQIIEENKTLTLKCQLTNIEIAVKDEAGVPLPFINVTLTYNYTTRDNATFPETESFETNSTGTIKLYNMFTNINYTIEALRYGFLFNTTFIEKLSAQPWFNITITCPTYTMFIHVFDSKREPLPSVQVSLIEWSSWSFVDWGTTDNQGNVNLSATFGRYEVNVYNYSTVLEREVVLNETTIDLMEDGMSVEIHCSIFNVNLHVEALDHFGQPIPNALVEVERKFGQEWVKIDSLPTGLDGFARFVPLRGLVGGDCRVSVYVAGKLCGIKYLYLDGSEQILFKIGKYTMIVGHPVETSQLIVYISIGLLVVVFGLALTYRRLLRRFVKKKETS